MSKVRIVFPSLFMLWEFKQVFRKTVVKTLFFRRSLVCVCTESQIELAIHAYNAKVTVVNERGSGKSGAAVPLAALL